MAPSRTNDRGTHLPKETKVTEHTLDSPDTAAIRAAEARIAEMESNWKAWQERRALAAEESAESIREDLQRTTADLVDCGSRIAAALDGLCNGHGRHDCLCAETRRALTGGAK